MSMRKIKGEKVGKMGMPSEASEAGDIRFPTFYIDIKHLPEAKDWEMGKTYNVTLQLRQTGLSIRKNEGKNEDMGNAEFEIIGIDPVGEVKEKKEPKARYTEKKS